MDCSTDIDVPGAFEHVLSGSAIKNGNNGFNTCNKARNGSRSTQPEMPCDSGIPGCATPNLICQCRISTARYKISCDLGLLRLNIEPTCCGLFSVYEQYPINTYYTQHKQQHRRSNSLEFAATVSSIMYGPRLRLQALKYKCNNFNRRCYPWKQESCQEKQDAQGCEQP
eukprot:1068225-Amphidinium_carterae.1